MRGRDQRRAAEDRTRLAPRGLTPRLRRRRALGTLVVATALVATALPAEAAPALELVTPGPNPTNAQLAGTVNRTGTLVLYEGEGEGQVTLYFRNTKKREVVSVNRSRRPGNGKSFNATMSDDGRYVAFLSDATDLVRGDVNAATDVFLHDRVRRTTVRLNVAEDGNTMPTAGAVAPVVSGDGSAVVFGVQGDLLQRAEGTASADYYFSNNPTLWLFSTRTRQVEAISVDNSGRVGNAGIAAISRDARYVAFLGLSRLSPADTDGGYDLYLRNRVTRKTTLIVVPAEPTNLPGFLHIADSGRKILVNSDDNYVVDVPTARVERADGYAGAPLAYGGRPTSNARLSANGKYVVYRSGYRYMMSMSEPVSFDLRIFRRNLATDQIETVWHRPADYTNGSNGPGCSYRSDDTYSPSLTEDASAMAIGWQGIKGSSEDADCHRDVFYVKF